MPSASKNCGTFNEVEFEYNPKLQVVLLLAPPTIDMVTKVHGLFIKMGASNAPL